MGDLGKSEDLYGERVDRCLYSGMMKFIGGGVLGVVSSVVLFKRQPWPVVLGFGGGIGSALTSCSYEFKYGSNVPLNRAPQLMAGGAHGFNAQQQNKPTVDIQQRLDEQYRSYHNMKHSAQERYNAYVSNPNPPYNSFPTDITSKMLQSNNQQEQHLGYNPWSSWPQETSHDQTIVQTIDYAQEESIPCQDCDDLDIVEVGSDKKEGGNDEHDDLDDLDIVNIGSDGKEDINYKFGQYNEEEGVNTENKDEIDPENERKMRLKKKYPMMK